MNEEIVSSRATHQGRNIKRLREMLGVKQEAIAVGLDITQQAMSFLEKKEQINDEILEKVSKVLKVPVDVIKNFDEEKAVNIITNTNTGQDTANGGHIHYKCTFNPMIDKIVSLSVKNAELYERMLKEKEERIRFLEELLKEKSIS
ncbi:MAG: helix-turn-helix domain-containing protein [Dysgonamonadaceae bacterium]|jgi:transcriptional regulator with XRE-family HTH domain|nr:helix-turn-helix domain-containing protein [Dysgonamonadaceae bacterium]